jgi:hypothetical protein
LAQGQQDFNGISIFHISNYIEIYVNLMTQEIIETDKKYCATM